MAFLADIANQVGPSILNQANQQNALTNAIDEATATAQAALKAQTDANALAAAAAMPQIDSESARASQDDEQRKLQQGSMFGIGLPDKLGSPPIGYRMLAGS